MSPHRFKLRIRRLWRRRASQVENISHEAGEQFEQNFLERLSHLKQVWRFAFAWVALVLLLGGIAGLQIINLRPYYQVLQPVPGGIYSEGINGSFTTASPLYAVSDVDTSVARLLFSGLLTFNSQDQLVGNLAQSWSADKSCMVYTVRLRPGLTWHDSKPLTAADVVFTYQTIQDPDAESPLFGSFQGVKVAAKDALTVTFTLPNPLSSFPYSLTNGIVPEHVLKSTNVVDLRSAPFNTNNPVGSGPFMWHSIGVTGVSDSTEAQISLVPFSHYWAGEPKLSAFNIYAFADENDMIHAYQNRELTAMAGLDSVPDAIAKDTSSQVYSLPLTAGVYVFFKTTTPLFRDMKVRQALVASSDRAAVVGQLGYMAIPVDEPLLKGQLGYTKKYAQATTNNARAKALLKSAGWQAGADGIVTKHGQRLSFTLAVPSSHDYMAVAAALQSQWRAIGVDAQVSAQSPADFQSILTQHSYDAVLYGVSIGVDPDVFVYWDSSQADVRSAHRFNFSEYASSTTDVSLEAARTRLDPTLRSLKYQSFLKAWLQDAPALGLYQPRFLYISHAVIYGLPAGQINTDAERFRNVQDWMIHRGWVTR